MHLGLILLHCQVNPALDVSNSGLAELHIRFFQTYFKRISSCLGVIRLVFYKFQIDYPL